MVLLTVRRFDGVYRSRGAELFALTHNGGCRILRDHKSAVQSGVPGQGNRKFPLAGNQPVYSLRSDTTQLRHTDGKKIESHRQGFTMEIPGRDDQIFVGHNHGIVCCRVNLRREHSLHIIEGILGSTVHLRYAPEGIGILNVCLFTGNNLASGK
ncbi:hypothetical protein SDC9_35994 [bioreactor metagenome]|uniref:Uncharacterized protein n=1 Tax=bioreactor metagenome TaxID=1076179 RepID=A0A644VH00_9ZZZZ